MADTVSPKEPLSFHISYGFVSGPLHGVRIRKLLEQAGYRQNADNSKCDIVIAHSTGAWRVPSGRLIVYVDIPLVQKKPGRTYVRAAFTDIGCVLRWPEITSGLRFLLLSFFYALINLPRNLRLIKTGSDGRPQVIQKAQSVYISNQDDPWQRSPQLNEYLDENEWSFISLPGAHNDIWIHPERYVAIINHYARLLAQTNA